MADPSQPPRLLQILIASCDRCPYCHWDVEPSCDADYGWNCEHPHGGFRIVDEGDMQAGWDHGDSVCGRLGQEFPDRCPLPLLGPTVLSGARTRVVQIEDTRHG